MRRAHYELVETYDARSEECAKDGYRTERQALAKADEIHQHKSDRDKLPCRVYLCDGADGATPCFRWHLTSRKEFRHADLSVDH